MGFHIPWFDPDLYTVVKNVPRSDGDPRPMETWTSSDEEIKCLACHTPIDSDTFISSTKCRFSLHRKCLELPVKINNHPLHSIRSLTVRISRSKSLTCMLCRKSYKNALALQGPAVAMTPIAGNTSSRELKLTSSFAIRCLDCSFFFHLLYGPLPYTIKHECHVDRLTLVDSIVDEDCEEFYCDVCECERDPRICAYYCEECKFVANVHGVVPEIQKIPTGDLKNVELKVAGENP